MFSPQDIEQIYEQICKDSDVTPNKKGSLAFRDVVRSKCKENQVILNNCRIGARASSIISKILRNQPVTLVDLSYNKLTENDAYIYLLQLVQVSHSLVHLNLSNNNLSEASLLDIGKFLAENRTLTHLELGSTDSNHCNIMTSASIITISDALCENQTLKYLGLAGTRLGKNDTHGIDALVSMLYYNNTLTSLNLEMNYIGTRSAISLMQTLIVNTTLHHLNLSENRLGHEVGVALDHLLSGNSTLSELSFKGNNLDLGILELTDCIKENMSLEIFSLQGNHIGNDGAGIIASQLSFNTTLRELNLTDNSITVEGGIMLAYGLLQNHGLIHLNLSLNYVEDDTAIALAESLKVNTYLESLELNSSHIGNRGAIAIAESLSLNQNTKINKLMLRDNFISREAGDIVYEILQVNHSLLTTDFRGNQIDIAQRDKLKELCSRNNQELRDKRPRELRQQIHHLKQEQVKLFEAQKLLDKHTSDVMRAQASLKYLDEEKENHFKHQQQLRVEAQKKIELENETISNIKYRIDTKYRESKEVEKQFTERILALEKGLLREKKEKEKKEAELLVYREKLHTTRDEHQRIKESTNNTIAKLNDEKLRCNTQKEILKLENQKIRQLLSQNNNIDELVERARHVLDKVRDEVPFLHENVDLHTSINTTS